MLPEDQDCEWCACLLIEATSLNMAIERGNHLAKSYVNRTPMLDFIRSYIDDDSWSMADHVPVIKIGQADEEIEW